MKKIYTSNESSEVEMLEDLIEKDGIPCTIQTAAGAIPFTDYYPELWVLNDDDYPKAKAILDRWLNPPEPPSTSWVCPKCGERIEAQFAMCWKCGTPQATPANPS